MTQPIVALMKVITFPLMGAEPHNISLTLPPTWKQAITIVKSVSEYMSTPSYKTKTDLLPHEPEEQLVPDRVIPHNTLV